MMPPLLYLTLEMTATFAANEYIESNCFGMSQEERLATWKNVYDTVVAALTYQQNVQNARHWRELLDVSVN